MTHLFSSFSIRDMVLSNRIVVSPMCQYSAQDGFSNEWHLVHLGSRAVGGAGLIMTEATAVSPEGRISPKDLGLWKDEHIPGLRQIVKFVRAQGAEIGVQLAHAGRKASMTEPWVGTRHVTVEEGGWRPVGPSALAFSEEYGVPEELNKEGIRKVVSDFVAAAQRAILADFRLIEIHAAHGYLLHQFLSPLSNHRKDEYGGDFQNRVRLTLEVAEAVRAVWPQGFPLFVRLSATDWAEGGWDPESSVRLAVLLKERGVDLVDCSSGGLAPGVKIPVGPSYQVGFSERIRREAGIPTGAVGMITEAVQAESILVTGQADLVFMAREALRDPYIGLNAAKDLGYNEIHWPLQYERARKKN